MNVSAALSIKTGTIGGTATGKFIDSDKFKESELNFFIQVSVTNQEHMPYDYDKFEPIQGLPSGRFNEVYGVCNDNSVSATELISNTLGRVHLGMGGRWRLQCCSLYKAQRQVKRNSGSSIAPSISRNCSLVGLG
jgi:hypothetical protein